MLVCHSYSKLTSFSLYHWFQFSRYSPLKHVNYLQLCLFHEAEMYRAPQHRFLQLLMLVQVGRWGSWGRKAYVNTLNTLCLGSHTMQQYYGVSWMNIGRCRAFSLHFIRDLRSSSVPLSLQLLLLLAQLVYHSQSNGWYYISQIEAGEGITWQFYGAAVVTAAAFLVLTLDSFGYLSVISWFDPRNKHKNETGNHITSGG